MIKVSVRWALLVCIAIGSSAFAASDSKVLLLRAKVAAGGAAWDGVGELVATGTEEASGLHGTWRSYEEVRTGRSAHWSDFGVFQTGEVRNSAGRVRQDASGGVHRLDSAFATEQGNAEAWLARRGYFRANAGGARIGPSVVREEEGRRFDVLTATPPHAQAIEMWFDAQTHLLDRTVQVMPISVVTTRFRDYRNVAGLQLPHEITVSDEEPANDDVLRVTSYEVLRKSRDEDFTPPRTPDDSTLAGGEVTLPIDFDGEVMVDAKINGQGPFTFIFDTGGHNILTPAAAQALGLNPVGTGVSGGSGEGSIAEQHTHVDTLELGGAVLRNQHFFVIPFPYSTVERGTRPPLAGLLGLELLERFRIVLNYRDQTMTLRPFAKSAAHAGTPVPITFSDDAPLLDARLDGRIGSFALDTGNSGTLVVQHLWAADNGLAAKLKAGLETVSFGAGGASRNWASRLDTFSLAGTTLRNLIARYAEDKRGAFSSRTEAGNLGNDVLANFTLDFDYRAGVIGFQPVKGYTSPPFNRSGIRATKERPEAFKVVLVTQDTPAAEAGIRAGDEIVSVDGTPSVQLSGRDLFRKITQPPGSKVVLTVSRDGKEQSATLRLRELLK